MGLNLVFPALKIERDYLLLRETEKRIRQANLQAKSGFSPV